MISRTTRAVEQRRTFDSCHLSAPPVENHNNTAANRENSGERSEPGGENERDLQRRLEADTRRELVDAVRECDQGPDQEADEPNEEAHELRRPR